MNNIENMTISEIENKINEVIAKLEHIKIEIENKTVSEIENEIEETIYILK